MCVCVCVQAEFFGLPGLADKASASPDADTAKAHGEAAGSSHSSIAGIQYDSVYLETGWHPVKSEFEVLQQQQRATMEVSPFAHSQAAQQRSFILQGTCRSMQGAVHLWQHSIACPGLTAHCCWTWICYQG